MKSCACLYVLYLLVNLSAIPVKAQISDKEISIDSVRSILKESSESFSAKTKEGEEKGTYLLEYAENLVKEINDPYIKLEVNKAIIDFFFQRRDTIKAEEYLAENFKIIKELNDQRELGLYYESMGIFELEKGNKKEGHHAFLTAEKLLRKYGKKEDVIDINYNLCLLYLREKKWNLVIVHALRSIDAVVNTQVKRNRKRNLNLFLAEGYINLGQFDKARSCFDIIEKEKSTYATDLNFKGKLFYAKGFYYEKQNNYKKASFLYSQSSKSFSEHYNKRSREISTTRILSNKLNLKEEENKRIRVENELKESQIKTNKYIILLSSVLIIGLIALSVAQNRKSKYKSKVNALLSSSNNKLKEANEKVDKALRAKSDFLDSVTHELFTPLTTIKGIVFLLQKEKLTISQKKQLKLISMSSDQLLNLLTDVIHLNNLEKDKFELKHEVFDLKTLLENLIDFSVVMKGNNNVINKRIDNDIPENLIGDMLKVSQVFLKILENALKFTKYGDIDIKVVLESKTEDKAKIRFSIRDTGIGMTKTQIDKAFENFDQGSVKVNRKFGGTGLGLSIAKKILELHNSSITIKSKPGKGTKISFKIDFDIPEKSAEENKIFADSRDELQKNINVLLVEDNKVNQLITKKIISDYGFTCDSAYDGKEAIDMVRSNKYSMILMDIMMPNMDGFEATKHIKKYDKKIPVVALTAISEKLNKDKFDEVGIATILHKPVNPELLYKTIMSCS
ncbi:hybrid sensor histidine kinase/response regulator [Aquimarina aquimarini]|uniref:hybrid sensor histidine kinase/response regulator n=1 Tax=Aquimarina aquimarini TaxID=1191734 RepID=UPI000D54C37C|nr:ATP-binding protein [Aquimarina aquimarini]